MLVEIGVIVGPAGTPHDDHDTVELSVQPFARLADERTIKAYPGPEVPRLILGLRGVAPNDRLAFVVGALHDEYVGPAAVSHPALRRLIAALGDEALNHDVAALRAFPFAIEMDPTLHAVFA